MTMLCLLAAIQACAGACTNSEAQPIIKFIPQHPLSTMQGLHIRAHGCQRSMVRILRMERSAEAAQHCLKVWFETQELACWA